MENVNFLSNDVKKFISSHNISKKYDEPWGVLQKKQPLKIY